MFGEVWNLWKIQSQVHLKTMAWGSLKPNHIVVRIRWGGYPHAALHAELQLSCDSLFQVLWCRGKGCYGQWWRWNTLLIYETKLSSDWSTVISSHLWCKCLHWEHQRLKKNPYTQTAPRLKVFLHDDMLCIKTVLVPKDEARAYHFANPHAQKSSLELQIMMPFPQTSTE